MLALLNDFVQLMKNERGQHAAYYALIDDIFEALDLWPLIIRLQLQAMQERE